MPRPRTALAFESLEDRFALSVTFRFDYSMDTAGFFNDPARRAALQQAADDLTDRIGTNLDTISPGGGNSWWVSLFDPASGSTVRVNNPTVNSGEILVYAGARDLPPGQAAVGGIGGYSMVGSDAWVRLVRSRGSAGASLWGGSIAFDTTPGWYTGSDPAGRASGQLDLYTVATHELGHVLGFGTAAAFTRLVSANRFTGPTAVAVNGGEAPGLSSDLSHWVSGTRFHGEPASMGSSVIAGSRYGYSELDYAVLQDIGWTITPAPTGAPPTTTPAPSNPTPNPSAPAPLDGSPAVGEEVAPTPLKLCPPGCACSACTVIGGSDGSVRLADLSGANPNVGPAFRPFPGFFGEVRATLADITGDGNPELISVTGPGGGSRVRITDPMTATDVLPEFTAFEASFTGGLFVAAADLTGDGRADIIVSPDSGGGGRVSVYSADAGGLRKAADFFGIEDPNFRGGARVAAADVNGDGRADLIVGAGTGGGPRVAVFDGLTVPSSRPNRLVGDFFAFGGADVSGLRNGVYVAAGDLNGDGKAELVFGGGPGGAPRVLVLDGSAVMDDPIRAGSTPVLNAFAFDTSDRGGARVAVDMVGGVPSVVAASGGGTAVRVFPRASAGPSFDLGGSMPSGGVFVG